MDFKPLRIFNYGQLYLQPHPSLVVSAAAPALAELDPWFLHTMTSLVGSFFKTIIPTVDWLGFGQEVTFVDSARMA